MDSAKSTLERVMETLKDSQVTSEKEMRDLMTRLQAARNVLVQNERKIWLRTKAGKEVAIGADNDLVKWGLPIPDRRYLTLYREALQGVPVTIPPAHMMGHFSPDDQRGISVALNNLAKLMRTGVPVFGLVAENDFSDAFLAKKPIKGRCFVL